MRHALLAGTFLCWVTACGGGEPPPREPPPPAAAAPTPADPPSPATPPAPDPPPAPPPAAPPDPPPPPPAPARGIPGANLTMGSMTMDGVELRDISCKVEGALGLLGGLTLGAGFAKRKARIDACSRGKALETTVSWTAAGGKMGKVKAEGPDPRVARCVERALTGAPAPLPAVCLATLVQGK